MGPSSISWEAKEDLSDIKIGKITFPLKHPKNLTIDKKADEIEYLRIENFISGGR